jgi:hypothetical protein
MSTALQIQGTTKGSRRAANALHKGLYDHLIAKGLTLEAMVEELIKRHRGATKIGVKTCLQAKIDDGHLVVNSEGHLDRVRRCNRRPAIAAVPA